MRDDVLFWKYDWNQLMESKKAAARKEADRMKMLDFEGSHLDQLAETICRRYSLIVPKLDLNNISVKHREVDIDISGDRMRHFSSRGPHFVKGTAIDVRIPFDGEPEMFQVKPNIWSTSIPRGRIEGNSVLFTISDVTLSKDEVKSKIDHQIEQLNAWLSYQEQSIGSFSSELTLTARQTLEARKKKLDGDADLISGLGYKIE